MSCPVCGKNEANVDRVCDSTGIRNILHCLTPDCGAVYERVTEFTFVYKLIEKEGGK